MRNVVRNEESTISGWEITVCLVRGYREGYSILEPFTAPTSLTPWMAPFQRQDGAESHREGIQIMNVDNCPPNYL